MDIDETMRDGGFTEAMRKEVTVLFEGLYSKLDTEPAEQMLFVLDAFMHFMMARMSADKVALVAMYKEFISFASARLQVMNVKAAER